MLFLQITTEYIQLNQALKLIGWVENGAEANDVIDQGLVSVNGQQEFRKRNKIYPGTTVELDGMKMKIITQGDD